MQFLNPQVIDLLRATATGNHVKATASVMRPAFPHTIERFWLGTQGDTPVARHILVADSQVSRLVEPIYLRTCP